MITQTEELLKAARDSLETADTVGLAEDFYEYRARVLLGEIKQWAAKLDPDGGRQPIGANQ